MTLWYRFKDAMYYLKCLLFKRYNVIKIRSLPPTWCDKDVLMREAMFQLLVDYVEKEKAFEYIDWNDDNEHSQASKKMKEAYQWIKVDRQKFVDEDDRTLTEWADARNQYYKEHPPEMREVPHKKGKAYEMIEPEEPYKTELKKLFEKNLEACSYWQQRDREVLQMILDVREYMWT